LAKAISDSAGGRNFETHTNDWNYISSALSSNSLPQNESFSITAAGDTISSKIIEIDFYSLSVPLQQKTVLKLKYIFCFYIWIAEFIL
jgi:hypothetical protein